MYASFCIILDYDILIISSYKEWMPMDSRDLEYVMAIARTGSFSQGAQMLFISQPALSQYIRRLEKNLGVTLFYRNRNKVELSPAGAYYVKKGQAILRQMQDLEQTMRHWQQEEQRQLSIGVSQFYGKWFLTPYLQNIQKSLPQYQVRIVDGESQHLELLMIQRKLDFAIYPAPVGPSGNPLPAPGRRRDPFCLQ